MYTESKFLSYFRVTLCNSLVQKLKPEVLTTWSFHLETTFQLFETFAISYALSFLSLLFTPGPFLSSVLYAQLEPSPPPVVFQENLD